MEVGNQMRSYRVNTKKGVAGRRVVLWVVLLSVSLAAQDRIASRTRAMWSGAGVRPAEGTTNPPRPIELAVVACNRGRASHNGAMGINTDFGVIEPVQARPAVKSSGGPQATLLQKFSAPPKRKQVIADCVKIIEQEVANKSGVSGLAISASYKMVESFKPGFVTIVMDVLFDDFCRALQPIVDEAQAGRRPIGPFFNAHSDRVAEALLSITDQRARNSKLLGVKATYEQLRGVAKSNVVEAIPRVATLIERHAGSV